MIRKYLFKTFIVSLAFFFIGACSSNTESKEVSIDGEIIGQWVEKQYTNTTFILYKKDGKVYGKTSYPNGQEAIDELTEEKSSNGIVFSYKEKGAYNGEYYILFDNGELGFFNKENKQFTSGKVIE